MRKLAAAAFTILLNFTPVFAAEYPSRPVTFLVPFAAGGPADTVARVFGERISKLLGQSIVVENVAGAGGSVGVGRVVQAAPDGYMIGVGNWSTHVLNGAIYSLSYDLVNDLVPIVQLPGGPQLIVSKKDVPAGNLAELIAWAKGRQVAVGTAGVGSAGHVSALFFERQIGAKFTYAHYRGAGPAMLDLVGGHIDIMFDQASNSLPHVRAGTIKAYAVTNPSRIAPAPDIPTVDEAGLPKFYASVWHGLWAPKGTPPVVVAKLNAAVRNVLSDAAFRESIAKDGRNVPGPDQLTPEALAALQKAEIDKWWPILKAANIKAQ